MGWGHLRAAEGGVRLVEAVERGARQREAHLSGGGLGVLADAFMPLAALECRVPKMANSGACRTLHDRPGV